MAAGRRQNKGIWTSSPSIMSSVAGIDSGGDEVRRIFQIHPPDATKRTDGVGPCIWRQG